MHYSKLLLAALPLAAAVPLGTVTTVVFETYTLTVTANGQVFTSVSQAAVTEAVADAVTTAVPSADSYTPVSTPDTTAAVVPSSPVVDLNSVKASVPSEVPVVDKPVPDTGSNGGSGCPIDPDSTTSPGMGSNPAKSVQESINMIRRMYNPSAKCLKWSPSLAKASTSCANIGSESALRANSAIVSDNGGYGGGNPWFTGPQATTLFESSMFTLLCQSPNDPALAGGCAGKVGEIDCSGGACTGHRDALVDAAGQYEWVGAGFSSSTKWASTSLSASCDIFGACS